MAEAGNQGNGTDMTSKVKILYFASLREAVGCSGEELDLPAGVATVGALRSHLAGRGEGWQALAAGRNVRAALNQKMAAPDTALDGGDGVHRAPGDGAARGAGGDIEPDDLRGGGKRLQPLPSAPA